MPRFSCAICFNRDNTISYANRVLQIERTRWRGTLPGCRVLVCEHLDSGCQPPTSGESREELWKRHLDVLTT